MDRPYTIAELQSITEPIFRANGVRRAVLFGSYAKGCATTRSDVDLFVDSGLRGLKFFGLLEDLTDALDADVDLIEASQLATGSPVAGEIGRSGVTIYRQ